MKSDLDKIMQENDLDALLITGPGQHNPAMVYMIGGGHLTGADLILKRGQGGVLFHGMMERDEAAKSGLETRSYSNYPMGALLKKADNNWTRAIVMRYQSMLKDAGVTQGRVALYGQTDLGQGYAVFSELQKAMPEITFVGDLENKVMPKAMLTKDIQEVERIRAMGKITTQVVAQTADFLTGHLAKGGVLIKTNGDPLTIGEVKGKINLWLSELGAENPEGTIFAIGRDAGVPHSTGNPTDLLRLGQTIVYDIFPCEAGGGYFYDFTRTWCLGYAPDETRRIYDDVKKVYDQVMSELKMGEHFGVFQKRTCEMFESMGHPTVLSEPETEVGYIHSLGHGLGLHIHERPFSGASAAADDLLIPGVIMSIEPGLYYPERGMGVRIEDTVWVRPDGNFEVLAPFPQDLVLPVKSQE